MADYSESTKQDIGDLVLKIRDLEVELVKQKNAGKSLVRPLRALADFFDPDNRGIELIQVANDYFATTHPINRRHDSVMLSGGNRDHPTFPFPDAYKDILKRIFELEMELAQLGKELEQAKERAQKVLF